MRRPLLEFLRQQGMPPGALPHVAVAELPTPVACLDGLWVKRDDVTGTPYGGNKVRKLEFLLAEALARGAKSVLTFGAAGSNHCLATATYAQQVGLGCTAMLVPQINALSVRRNLLADHKTGAKLDYRSGRGGVALGVLGHFRREFTAHGCFPSVFPAGGSSPTGCLGYVNAALELAEQVAAGECPEPRDIYVASGTMGTAIGLLVGLGLTSLKSKVVAVAVTSAPYTSAAKAEKLFGATQRLLNTLVPGIPLTPFPAERFTLREDFLGECYAKYTPESVAAVRYAAEHYGLKLEGTYTGKALAALLADMATNTPGADSPTLFWNTYNSRTLDVDPTGDDYLALPPGLQSYFTESVQPLDLER